jgi:hypothetical protein
MDLRRRGRVTAQIKRISIETRGSARPLPSCRTQDFEQFSAE